MTHGIAVMPDIADHLDDLVQYIVRGRLVIFLGAGANLCERDPTVLWTADQREFLPTGTELADYLAQEFGVSQGDLPRVAQHAAVRTSPALLNLVLRELFNADYPITRLHHFLAALPSILRSRGYPVTSSKYYRRLLFVSTNYDDLLERAFVAAGERYHLLVYEAEGVHRGKFFHRSPDGALTRVDRPNAYARLNADDNPVVMKFHGSLDRIDESRDTFVITDDHYIEYLTHTDAADFIPAPLPVLFANCSLLFLGHGLRDWNLRVLLHRIWQSTRIKTQSWAVQRDVEDLDRKLWQMRGRVELINFHLGDYVSLLEDRLRALQHAPARAGLV
jgi:SIR2-like domain